MTEAILREQQVAQLTGLSRQTRWRMVKHGRFPKPVRLTGRSSGWLRSEVDAWIKARADQREGAQ